MVAPYKNLHTTLLFKPQLQLSTEPVAADGIQHWQVPAEQGLGVILQTEPQTLLVTHGPHDAGGVVHEDFIVEHPYEAALQVSLAIEWIKELALSTRVKRKCHRVDGEVTSRKVVFHVAVGYLWQRAWTAVVLATGGYQVKGYAVHLDLGRGEL